MVDMGADLTVPVKALLGSGEWYTPAWVFEMLGMKYDLDPCSPGADKCFVPARFHGVLGECHTNDEGDDVYEWDGLVQQWWGKVWLNPDFKAAKLRLWTRKLLTELAGEPHWKGKISATVLTPNRLDMDWAQALGTACDSMLLIGPHPWHPSGRVQFVPGVGQQETSPLNGHTLWAFGEEESEALFRAAVDGHGVFLERRR